MPITPIPAVCAACTQSQDEIMALLFPPQTVTFGNTVDGVAAAGDGYFVSFDGAFTVGTYDGITIDGGDPTKLVFPLADQDYQVSWTVRGVTDDVGLLSVEGSYCPRLTLQGLPAGTFAFAGSGPIVHAAGGNTGDFYVYSDAALSNVIFRVMFLPVRMA